MSSSSSVALQWWNKCIPIHHQPFGFSAIHIIWVNSFWVVYDKFKPLHIHWNGHKLSAWASRNTRGNNIIEWLERKKWERDLGARAMIISATPKGSYINEECVSEGSQTWFRVLLYITCTVYILGQRLRTGKPLQRLWG